MLKNTKDIIFLNLQVASKGKVKGKGKLIFGLIDRY